MILWINGAFGAGRPQAAYTLRRRIKNAYVYDPENAGYFIRSNLPASAHKEDFQDYAMWRAFNRDMLAYISRHYAGTVIVPMTITNWAYYEEITSGLPENCEVKHFILCAKKETLLKRLAARLEGPQSWAALQIDRCIKAFSENAAGQKIHTDMLNIDQVVERIASLAGIALLEDRRSRLRRRFDQLVTQYRHIR